MLETLLTHHWPGSSTTTTPINQTPNPEAGQEEHQEVFCDGPPLHFPLHTLPEKALAWVLSTFRLFSNFRVHVYKHSFLCCSLQSIYSSLYMTSGLFATLLVSDLCLFTYHIFCSLFWIFLFCGFMNFCLCFFTTFSANSFVLYALFNKIDCTSVATGGSLQYEKHKPFSIT